MLRAYLFLTLLEPKTPPKQQVERRAQKQIYGERFRGTSELFFHIRLSQKTYQTHMIFGHLFVMENTRSSATPGFARQGVGWWDPRYTPLTRPRPNTSFVWHKAQTPSNYYYYYYYYYCLLYTSPSPRDKRQSRMPSSA